MLCTSTLEILSFRTALIPISSFSYSECRTEGSSSLWVCNSSCRHEQSRSNSCGRVVCRQTYPSSCIYCYTCLGCQSSSTHCHHQRNTGQSVLVDMYVTLQEYILLCLLSISIVQWVPAYCHTYSAPECTRIL